MLIGIHSKDHRLGIALRKILGCFDRKDIGVMLISENGSYDVALIGTNLPHPNINFKADTLIVPDCINADELSSDISGKVISFGLRRKNTVTASSLINDRLVVSIQRSIPTTDDNTVGEQEIIINIRNAEQTDEILGIVAVLLVIGISSDELSSLVFSL